MTDDELRQRLQCTYSHTVVSGPGLWWTVNIYADGHWIGDYLRPTRRWAHRAGRAMVRFFSERETAAIEQALAERNSQ